MVSLTYTPDRAEIELGTYIVSTIIQENDTEYGDCTAIYLRNIDKEFNMFGITYGIYKKFIKS